MVVRIAYTLLPVRDMPRARRFYGEVLGLPQSHDFEGKWVEFDVGGGVLALADAPEVGSPSTTAGASIVFEVDDVDATMARLVEGGGKVLIAAFDTPVCRMGFIEDPEGNGIGIHKVTD